MKLFKALLVLELIISGFATPVLATNPISEELVTNIRNKVIVDFFEHKLNDFSKLAYPNAPITPSGEQQSNTLEDTSCTLIYNQHGYIAGFASSDAKTGNPLFYNDIPVGYSIHIPENPKGIFTEVYGGGDTIFKTNKEDLRPLHKALLSLNVAVIRLNLVDVHYSNPLRLGRTPQQKMRKETFAGVQESIHHFCSTFKSTPEILHEDLKHLKGLPLFLFGQSFGGLVTLRHAELFPGQDSFDGYISLNGGLSGDMPGWSENRDRWWYLDDVNETAEIQKITQPILLLHTATDSNVNMEATNNWAKKARKILFKNHIPLKVIYSTQINPAAVEGEGHYIPKSGGAFNEYVETIHHFITTKEDLDRLSAQTALTVFQWELYANKMLRHSTAQEKFLSEAFKFFKTHPNGLTAESFESDWEQYYNPLFNVVYLFEEFIRKNDLKYFAGKNTTDIKEGFDKDRCWLSYDLWSIRDIARDQDVIEKNLLAHLPVYLFFMKGKNAEYMDGNFPDTFDQPFLKSLITDKVVNAFWKALTNPEKSRLSQLSYRAHSMLAFSYFLNNPTLLKFVESRTDKFWWTTHNKWLREEVFSDLISQQQESEKEARNEAKAALKKVILKNQKKEDAVRST